MAAALVRAAADHGRDAVNLRLIAICEQGSDHNRYWLAVEARSKLGIYMAATLTPG